IEKFPAIVRRLGPLAGTAFQDHGSWSQNADMAGNFRAGQPQSDVIEAIRTSLRGTDTRHVRVVGEPGIGKTRLVLEAARADDLAPLFLYCSGTAVRDAPIIQVLADEVHRTAILIVDECDPDAR